VSAPKSPRQRTIHHIATSPDEDPYRRPSFSLQHRLLRFLWRSVYFWLYRFSPTPFFFWRAWLLRAFGATMGPKCNFYPTGKVWAPWNLVCEDYCTLSDQSEIYNPSPIHLGSHCTISQQAFICGATHDYNHPDFPMVSYTMHLGAQSWISARASVSPGVQVGPGAILGLGSVAFDDLEPWSVYRGVPAVKIKSRVKHELPARLS
jgi:putative colanic acid biosynthesis acetyltransferase WcaF